MAKITKRLVDALAPTGKEQFVWDSELPGFGIRQSKAGVVTYVVQYRIEGRQRRYKIGRHGTPWTPETARIEARRLIGEVADGRDPQRWRFESRDIPNIAKLCDVYVEEGMYSCKESTIINARGCLENHIGPLLGTRRADTVIRSDIERMMRDIAAGKTARSVKKGYRRRARVRGGRGAANNALVILSGALNFAIGQKIRPDNPALGVKQYPGRKLDRFLSPAELATLGDVLAAASSLGIENPFALTAIKLLILTGCRKNEILTLRRSYVDNYHRCLRLPDSKTGAKVVHLGAAAMRLVEAIPEVVGNPFLLPGKKDGTHVTDLQSVWERVRKTANLEDVRIHDLRHSFASVGAGLGDSMLIISKLLCHASPKTTERYTHLFDHPLKAAADRIAEQITRYMNDEFDAVASPPETQLIPVDETVLHASGPSRSILGTLVRTEWLDTPRAAFRLGLTVGTLQTYRWMGNGPAFRKIGRRVVYAVGDLDAWKRAGNGEIALKQATFAEARAA